ncbi:hypothetical protein ES703_68349 [subsurface metagenome]
MKKYQNKSWLRKKCLDEKASCESIAWDCNVSRMTIWRWLVRFEIPVRPQREAVSKRWVMRM